MADGNKTILGGVPNALPALIKAQRMQEKVAQFGFDWEDIGDVKAKVIEELDEMADVSDDQDLLTEEFGDLLFSLVNYARFKGIDANRALDLTNRKFRKRFEHIERQAPKPLKQMTLTEMDLLWNESKQLEVIEEVNRTGS